MHLISTRTKSNCILQANAIEYRSSPGGQSPNPIESTSISSSTATISGSRKQYSGELKCIHNILFSLRKTFEWKIHEVYVIKNSKHYPTTKQLERIHANRLWIRI